MAALAELLGKAAVSLGVTAFMYEGFERFVAPRRSVYKPRIPAVPKTPSVAKPGTRPATKAHAIPQPRVREYSEHKSKARPSTKDKHEAGQARKKRDQGGEKKKKSGTEADGLEKPQVLRGLRDVEDGSVGQICPI